MREYKFDKYSNFFLVRPILFWILGPLILFILIFFFKNISIIILIKSYMITILVLIPFFPLWLIVIYLNYKKYNGNSRLLVFDNYKTFIYSDLEGEIEFENKKIEKIVVYLSYPEFEKDSITAFWTEYSYVKIILINKDEIFISCLLCKNFADYLEENKIVYKKIFFPLIQKR